MDKFDLVRFTDNDFELDVRADSENETVWLTQKEMALLFAVSTDNIGLHINNILKEKELDESTTEESSVVQNSDVRNFRTSEMAEYVQTSRQLV